MTKTIEDKLVISREPGNGLEPDTFAVVHVMRQELSQHKSIVEARAAMEKHKDHVFQRERALLEKISTLQATLSRALPSMD